MTVTAHIHAPEPDSVKRAYGWCTTCQCRRLQLFVHTPWYGWDQTCLYCGESWTDGVRLERPFRRGWRKEKIEYAKRLLEWYQSKQPARPVRAKRA